jgi:hypothetical protein
MTSIAAVTAPAAEEEDRRVVLPRQRGTVDRRIPKVPTQDFAPHRVPVALGYGDPAYLTAFGADD